jgi:hypothetical protein
VPTRKPWLNIELAPGEVPSVTRCDPTDRKLPYYEISWERFGLSVMLEADELQALIGRAMVAQSDRAPVGA